MGSLTQPSAASATLAQTFPQLLLQHAARLASSTAMREKHRGIWRTWSWNEAATETRGIAAGLRSLGFCRGDVLAILGDNRPRLYWAMCAAQMLGGVALPLSADTPAEVVTGKLRKHAVRFAVIDGQERCGKIAEACVDYAGLERCFLDNAQGMPSPEVLPGMCSLDEVVARGQDYDRRSPGDVDSEIAAGRATDPAVILVSPDAGFASPGCAGASPEEVVQSHAQSIAPARAQFEDHAFASGEDLVAYLPLGSWMDQHFSYALALVGGLTVNCPESVDTVPIDMREVGPTVHAMPARMLARLQASTMHRMRDANALHRALFGYFTRRAIKSAGGGLPIGPLRWLGEVLFHAPLRDVLGLSRTKVLFVDRADGSEDALEFFRAIGLRLVNTTDWRHDAEAAASRHSVACGTRNAVTASEP